MNVFEGLIQSVACQGNDSHTDWICFADVRETAEKPPTIVFRSILGLQFAAYVMQDHLCARAKRSAITMVMI